MSRGIPSWFCLAIALLLLAGTPAQGGKSIALILDASNSMNAKLPEGRSRIDAAKAAVEEIVGKLLTDVRISLRAYGHQSPTSKHDCEDTELMVGFDGLAANKAAILAKSHAIKAQGYTPITYVIKLAAEDVGKENAKPRVVILVSDGKETCKGDPCATAKALADADASLVIHTIGFAVDSAAKYQLQCIARVARGKHYDADSAGKLAAALGEAVKAEAPPPPPVKRKTTTIVVSKPKPGKLAMKNANIIGHAVTDAQTGKSLGSLSPTRSVIEVPAGFYNVKLGNAVWKSIEVKPGETTTIEPGVLEIKNAGVSGHKVLDNETGETIGNIVSSNPRMTVLPSTFAVTFGKAVWKDIEVKAGEHKVLNPGTITVNGASVTGTPIRAEDGKVVASVSPLGNWAPLPPGKYVVDLGSQKVPIDLAEGQDAVIDVKSGRRIKTSWRAPMAHDSGLRRAGLAFALFAGFSLLPSYAASSQISPEACSAAPCTIPNVFDPDLADVKAFNNQALADLVQAIKVGHNNNDHTCYPTAASITIHSPTYQIKGLPPSSLGDERAKALINYLTGQGLVQNADFDLSSSIDQANKVDVNFNGVDRDPPKFYSLKSNPPKGTKVKAGDRIAVTITASERHEDGHKSTPTGVKTVQVRADDGLIEPIGNYSPQPCERRSLDVNYMVPSNPPSIIHLQVVVEDAVGNQDFRTAEFPTGDWYGTLTGHHKGGWANHATVVQFNFSEKPGGTIEGRGRVAVTSEKWASASCKGTTTTPPDINISIGGRRVGDQFQLELENPILSGTISSICQGTSGTSPWRASLSALLAESVRPQVAARDGATNERHKQIGYFNSDAKIELHRARSN